MKKYIILLLSLSIGNISFAASGGDVPFYDDVYFWLWFCFILFVVFLFWQGKDKFLVFLDNRVSFISSRLTDSEKVREDAISQRLMTQKDAHQAELQVVKMLDSANKDVDVINRQVASKLDYELNHLKDMHGNHMEQYRSKTLDDLKSKILAASLQKVKQRFDTEDKTAINDNLFEKTIADIKKLSS